MTRSKVLITGLSGLNNDNKDAWLMSVIRTFSEPEKAWLAAAIDGEGSIGLYKLKRGYRVLQIQLSNTNREFTEQVRLIIGCGSSIMRTMFKPMGHKGRKPIYHYMLKGQRCISVLEQILPYLIIKREKANTILDELKLHPLQGFGGWWAHATPEERTKRSERLKARWNDPKQREVLLAGSRKFWSDPKSYEIHSVAMKKAAANPEVKARRAERERKAWEDPDTRQKRIAGIKRSWARKKAQKEVVA